MPVTSARRGIPILTSPCPTCGDILQIRTVPGNCATGERRPPALSRVTDRWSHGVMNATSMLERPEPTGAPALTAADRCDYCGARAWVRVTLASGQLLFCAHHARQHMEALRASALSIQDDTHLLVADEKGTGVR